MNRRTSLKAIMAASAGLVALPSWAKGWTLNEITSKSSFIFSEQEILSAVVDTIIPAGNSVGAITVGVDKFLQKLFDNCYENDVRDNVKTQLLGLEAMAKNIHNKSFYQSDQLQRQEMLLKLSVSEMKTEKEFFELIKSETIRGFNTSKEVMLDYLKYKGVPGHYYGCVDVNV